MFKKSQMSRGRPKIKCKEIADTQFDFGNLQSRDWLKDQKHVDLE